MVEEKVASPDLTLQEPAPSTEEVAPEKVEPTEQAPILTDEQRQKVLSEYLESEDYKKSLQSEADKRVTTIEQRYKRQLQEREQALRQQVQQEREQAETKQRVNWLTQLKDQDVDQFIRALDEPANAAAWAGAKAPREVDESALIARGAVSAFEGIKSQFHKGSLSGLSDDDWAALQHKADSEARTQDEWFGIFMDAAVDLRAKTLGGKELEEARQAAEAQARAKLRKGEGAEDVGEGAGKAKPDTTLEGSATFERKAEAFEQKYGYRPRGV